MLGFERVRSVSEYFDTNLLGMGKELDAAQIERFKRMRTCWNFYEGYHWEELPKTDGVEITVNYCRAFIDKMVSFEVGKGFTTTVKKQCEEVKVKGDLNVLQYIQDVWGDNDVNALITDIAQMKDVTGESWVQVNYLTAEELKDKDPYNEYPEGRVTLTVLPTTTVIADFDPHDRTNLQTLTIIYAYEKTVVTPLLHRNKLEKVWYKQIWTKDTCTVQDGNEPVVEYPNKYGVIPFVQIKNLGISGRTYGRSDLEDIIPLNTEYNMKDSNVSEIIDYHAAPVTVVYGAKIGNLEKGANKLWGGLSKDARVENLELRGDLGVATNYLANLKQSMCEIGGVPEQSLGGAQGISNTSGVALQYANMPLIEKTRLKRLATTTGIENINKMILLVSLLEGLITKPASLSNKDFYYSEVKLIDTLPKDELLELQAIQQEMKMGLESRRNAMIRMGKENIEELTKEIDADREAHPDLYGVDTSKDEQQLNSGFTNGQTTLEQLRIETTGKNGGE